ncbi:MAG: glycosyltransferase family 9 protein [bacterium]
MSTSSSHRVLLIRLSSLGDIILTEPVVRLLKEKLGAEVTYVTKEQFLPVLELIPNIDRAIDLPTDQRATEALQQLAQQGFTEVVDLQRNWRSRAARHKAGGDTHLACKEWWRRTAAVRFKRLHTRPHHAVERYLTALRHHGIAPTQIAPRLQLPDKYREWWEKERPAELREDSYYVIGAGAAHATKRAPLELWCELDKVIRDRYHARPLLLGAPTERDTLAGFADGLRVPEQLVITESPVGRAAAMIDGAQFVISNDSGLGHLAAGLGKPILALFGPTHPVLGFAPLGDNADYYTINEFCSPCSRHGKRPCFREERFCFTKMGTEVIVGKLDRLIAG